MEDPGAHQGGHPPEGSHTCGGPPLAGGTGPLPPLRLLRQGDAVPCVVLCVRAIEGSGRDGTGRRGGPSRCGGVLGTGDRTAPEGRGGDGRLPSAGFPSRSVSHGPLPFPSLSPSVGCDASRAMVARASMRSPGLCVCGCVCVCVCMCVSVCASRGEPRHTSSSWSQAGPVGGRGDASRVPRTGESAAAAAAPAIPAAAAVAVRVVVIVVDRIVVCAEWGERGGGGQRGTRTGPSWRRGPASGRRSGWWVYKIGGCGGIPGNSWSSIEHMGSLGKEGSTQSQGGREGALGPTGGPAVGGGDR